MPVSHFLNAIGLTPAHQLQTLVENRRIFNLKHCELNIFESYEASYRVPLTFNDFVITSMVAGKKVMHILDQPAFEYVPGETVIMPPNETMVIDFPEARKETPTQCIALTISNSYILNTMDYVQEYYNTAKDEPTNWQLKFDQYHLNNDATLADNINSLMTICSSNDIAKSIYADLKLKELMVRLLQKQHLLRSTEDLRTATNKSRAHYVLHYINTHLTDKILVNDLCRKAYLSRNAFFAWFKEQFGITPLDYVNQERIKLARQMLAQGHYNVSQVAVYCGFNDVNYFVRMFKKVEGITPGRYLQCARPVR